MMAMISMIMTSTMVNVAIPDIMGAYGIGQDRALDGDGVPVSDDRLDAERLAHGSSAPGSSSSAGCAVRRGMPRGVRGGEL